MNKIIISLSIVILFLLGCDSDKPTMPAGTVSVTGDVTAQFIDMPSEYNDSLDSEYYTVQTGLPARIDFVQGEEAVYSVKTNMLSRFSLAVEPGSYAIITYTEHGYPQHNSISYIGTDTTLTLGTYYTFRVLDSVMVSFTYFLLDTFPDHFYTPEEELDYLNQLNVEVDNILLPDRARSEQYYTYEGAAFNSEYTIPINGNMMTYDAYNRVVTALLYERHDFPREMRMGNQRYEPVIVFD